MDNIGWIIWLILGVGLIIAEIFTLGFVLFWFGIGALAAAVAGWLGLGFAGQFLIFAVVSVAMTVLSRTILYDYLPHGTGGSLKSGVDSLPGKIGTVTIASKGALNEGAVRVFGSEWTAFPIDEDVVLTEGEKVEVVEVRGSSIYVRRSSKELGGWKQD
ncbi:MAG: NfeD family protein [Blastocatellia bacterium]|nr:NfeD family protein [Blastocatellia bacterium]